MSESSNIEWTDASWNPLRGTIGRWFCTKVDELCKHCYSERMNVRFGGTPFVHGKDAIRLDPAITLAPLRWKRPRKIFVCSMTDLFHETVQDAWLLAIFGTMRLAPHHTFQILTKRAPRMRDWALAQDVSGLLHLWWGVSAGTKKGAAERIPALKDAPVRTRWLSIEPLLEDIGRIDLSGISWVVAGAESGHGARPTELDWVRSLRDQALEQGAAFFFKQAMVNGKIVGLPALDGQVWAQFPPALAKVPLTV